MYKIQKRARVRPKRNIKALLLHRSWERKEIKWEAAEKVYKNDVLPMVQFSLEETGHYWPKEWMD